MAAMYNTDTFGTRVGNWVEEMALKEMTGVTRVEGHVGNKFANTGSRVLAHSEGPEGGKAFLSVTRDVHNCMKHKGMHVDAKALGPRAARAQRDLETDATKRPLVAAGKMYFETTAGASYLRHSTEEYASEKGKRVMRSADGKPLPKDARDMDFLQDFCLSHKPGKLSESDKRRILPKGDALTSIPVTLYSQRLAEGVFPSSSATGGGKVTSKANPFGRSAVMSSALTVSHKKHAGARDFSGRIDTDVPVGMKTVAGSELSMEALCDHLRSVIVKTHGASGLSTLVDIMESADKTGDGVLNIDEFRAGLKKLGIELPAREMVALMNYFDTDGSGKVCLAELYDGLKGDIKPVRRDLISAAFEALDKSGNGFVSLRELAMAVDASKHPDVVAGRRSEKAIIGDLIARWDCGNEDDAVSRAEFEDYYRGLSAGIASDAEFEKVFRNLWHLSGSSTGPETSTQRVRIRYNNGTDEYVDIPAPPTGLCASDAAGVKALLRRKGKTNIHSVYFE